MGQGDMKNIWVAVCWADIQSQDLPDMKQQLL
jgi:hypothetical protein